VLVVDSGKSDLLPAGTAGKAGSIEVAFLFRLDQADERHGFLDRGLSALPDQLHEGVDGHAGCGQSLGDRLGRGPARAAVAGDALRFVERGGIEARLLGETGGGQPSQSGKAIEGRPDLGMSEHDAGPLWT
jgi:hypothetical protein